MKAEKWIDVIELPGIGRFELEPMKMETRTQSDKIITTITQDARFFPAPSSEQKNT